MNIYTLSNLYKKIYFQYFSPLLLMLSTLRCEFTYFEENAEMILFCLGCFIHILFIFIHLFIYYR